MKKVDAFSHVLPEPYSEALTRRSGGTHAVADLLDAIPELSDMERRLELMEEYDIDRSVLVPATPAVETVADRVGAAELARRANDAIADIVADHPDRFRGVATVPMNNPEAMVEELDRAVTDLDLEGVLLYSSIDNRRAEDAHIEGAGRPIDVPEFEPFYDRVESLGVPVWLHPGRPKTSPDYVGEQESKYLIWQMYGWPFELSAAMARLVFGGVLERHPDMTVIAHHAGGMIPLLAGRMPVHYDLFEMTGTTYGEGLSKPYVEHFRQFYVDTATFGSVPALRAAYEFFGPGNMLFGTDAPFDAENGRLSTGKNHDALAAFDVSEEERRRIFSENAEDLLG